MWMEYNSNAEQIKQQYARQKDFLIFILHANIMSPTFISKSF